VFERLKRADDFMTVAQLQAAEPAETYNRIQAALHHLRNYRAVECMESDGQLWWYATPDNDTRSKTVDERTPEQNPRRARKPRIKGEKK
jgi:hypothetical protein